MKISHFSCWNQHIFPVPGYLKTVGYAFFFKKNLGSASAHLLLETVFPLNTFAVKKKIKKKIKMTLQVASFIQKKHALCNIISIWFIMTPVKHDKVWSPNLAFGNYIRNLILRNSEPLSKI